MIKKQKSKNSLDSLVARERISFLTKGNPHVLNHYDHFIQDLSKLFFAGKLNRKSLDVIIEALVFSSERHRLQLRKGIKKTPYIVHPIAVVHALLTIGNVYEQDVLVAAILHDTVEDTKTTFEEIQERYGALVADFVREVTDDKSLPWRERKRLQVVHSPMKTPGAALIKLADKLCNLKDLLNEPPGNWTNERIDLYFNWSQDVVNNLPQVNSALKNKIDEVIQEYWKRRLK